MQFLISIYHNLTEKFAILMVNKHQLNITKICITDSGKYVLIQDYIY